jgi:site-specific DNA-methyltransferase (adenine-specific)
MNGLIEKLTERGMPHWLSDDGSVLLVNGDCLEALPLIEAGRVDAVVTDAPYAIGVGAAFVRKGGSVVHDGSGSFNDAETWAWANNLQFLRPGANVAAFHKRGDDLPDCISWWHRFYLIKSNPPCTPRPVFQSGVEECSIGFIGGGKRTWNGGGTTLNYMIVSVSESHEGGIEHPSPKPIRAMAKLVEVLTDAGDLILDPFAGSATTLVAAMRLNRRCIGIELDRNFYEVAKKRLIKEQSRTPLFPEPKPKQVGMFE